MAEVWYFSVNDTSTEGKTPIYDIPLRKCIELFDLRPSHWVSSLDEFPTLRTGNPLIDNSGLVYVLFKITEEEIKESEEGSFKAGWYKSPHTVIATEKILREAT